MWIFVNILMAVLPIIWADTATDYMESLFAQHPSIKSEPPSAGSKRATQVRIGIYVNSISEEKDGHGMQQTLNIYLRNSWKDHRLAFDPDDFNLQTHEILLPDGAWKKIWVPDLFIRNEQKALMHGTARENVLLKVNSTGYAWFVIKATTTTSCPMKLQKYPFDTQTCPIMFESFRYTMDTMYLAWLDNAVDIDSSVQLTEFTLLDTILYDCSQNYTAGAFPCLEIRFVMRREIGVYLLQVFLPTILVVIMSWFNMWLEPHKYAQRIAILIILALAVIFQYESYGREVADVSYIKAFDVWMILCIFFLVIAMLEATLVNVIGSNPANINQNSKYGDPEVFQMNPNTNKCCNISLAKTIDIVSRIMFPVAFSVCAVLYFFSYVITPTI